MIKCVEKLRSELDRFRFGDLRFFDNGEIVVVDAGTAKEIARRVTKTEKAAR